MDTLSLVLVFIFSLVPGIIGGYFIYKDRNRLIGTVLILMAIFVNLISFISNFYSKQKIDRLERYSQIARMGPWGSDIIAGRSMSFVGGLPAALKGTYIEEENKFTYICTEESVNKMIEVIKNYPDFPFSYYGVATCKKDQNKDGWKGYAKKAVEIFKQTIQIKEHNLAHDECLEALEKDLQSF